MHTSELADRTIEVITTSGELYQLSRDLRKYQQNPEQFWQINSSQIAQGLASRYSNSDNPQNQIIIPVYHNAYDLPPLLYSLAKQEIAHLGTTKLTMLMHNNGINSGKERDASWDIIEELQESGVPIDVLPLMDPLLTGPYTSWQYALAMNSAQTACAILDADSMAPKNWLKSMVKPIYDNPNVLFTGGQRIYAGGAAQACLPSSIYYALNTGTYILNNTLDIVKNTNFMGGQAAYRGDFARKAVTDILGFPDGDILLSEYIYNNCGSESFQFSYAPVVNTPDQYRNISVSSDYAHMVRRGLAVVVPPLSTQLKPTLTREQNWCYQLKNIHHYTPWARDIVTTAFSQGNMTPAEIIAVFKATADKQQFIDNRHVEALLQDGLLCFDSQAILDFEGVATAIRYIGYTCVRPTMIDYMNQEKLNNESTSSGVL